MHTLLVSDILFSLCKFIFVYSNFIFLCTYNYYYYYYYKIEGESLRLKLSDSHGILCCSNLADSCTGYIAGLSVTIVLLIVVALVSVILGILVGHFWKRNKEKEGRLVTTNILF